MLSLNYSEFLTHGYVSSLFKVCFEGSIVSQIATLEAQVARREAELYAYKPCSCRSSAASASEPSAPSAHRAKLQPAGTTLTKAQYQLIEEETSIRQRTLEIEIDGIRRKV